MDEMGADPKRNENTEQKEYLEAKMDDLVALVKKLGDEIANC